MSQLDIDELVARGKIPGAYPFSGYGARTTAGAETNYAIWPNGPFSLPAASGVQMSVVSTSANDTAAGTGARILEMHYLDSRLEPHEEYITLNGITPVLTAATDIRFIQCLHIHVVGSGLKADGTITASNGGTTYSIIATGDVRCSSSMRMVPANKQLFLLGAVGSSISGTAQARTQLSLVANVLDDHQYVSPLLLIPFATIGVQDNGIGFRFPPMMPFPPGTVIGGIHTSDKACTVSLSWFGRIEGVS